MKRSNTPKTPYRSLRDFFRAWDADEMRTRHVSAHEERLFKESLWWMVSKDGLYTYNPRTKVIRFYSDDGQEKGTIVWID